MKRILRFCNYFFIGCSYLTSKKIMVILVVILFISLLGVSYGYQEKLAEMEQKVYSDNDNPNSYYNENLVQEFDTSMAILNLMKCYQEKIDERDFTTLMKNYVDQLIQLYEQDKENFSFLYKDLYSGFTISYNEEARIFTASTIKAPAMIYLYEMASFDKIDLEEKLVYTENYQRDGSGILKEREINTSYSVRELIEYAIRYSDNIAYTMLMDKFGRENILDFWSDLGTKHIFGTNTIWGFTSANDAAIYMDELYRFSKENEKYGSKLMEYFKNADWKLLTNKKGEFNTASKGGWSGQAIHDVAIVFEENPYILIVMSNKGEGGYASLFKQTSELAGMLHDEYWKYKQEVCGKIKLY